ncbi:D-alanyl-D-alanine carboxypeptidase family protein [Clostridium sp. JN-1]|uniref:D-alanyl-D-alanine carboxypeptidase family protein n=1 Tax=Clostridium sp. JN-1 TaxID=2483110 RepID=UPI000F0BCB5A|nr:D-alanyl-D-alanine carboxypeptidase family protein [Clostridium sp. JN-1]
MKKSKLFLILTFIITLSLAFNVCVSSSVHASSNSTDSPQVSIYGKSALTIDMQTGEIIYAKDIDKRLYPASTTKLLTAILLTENKNKNDVLKYTEGAKKQPESSLNVNIHPIDAGETISAEDVMDGMLLFSGNDMAYMIADNIEKGEPDFINKMNEKAKSLNLKNTHFVTPNGLHNPDHYTTTYELSVIANEAFQNPWIRETIGKQESTFKSSKGTTFTVKNTNKLLGKNGCIGGKTGYTSQAGRCLVAFYDRGGRKMLGIVMNSVYDPNDTFVFNDMEKIIDLSYSVKPAVLYGKNSTIETKTADYKPLGIIPFHSKISVPLYVKDDITYYDNEINKDELSTSFNLSNINFSSLTGKTPIGTITIKQRNSTKSYKLYSSINKSDLIKKYIPEYIAFAAVLILLICILVKFFVSFKRKSKL